MDHASTTFCLQEAVDAMVPFFTENYGNPASIHRAGREAAKAVARARSAVAESIGATPAEIIFTSGGSESDNMAVRGVFAASPQTKKHVITTAIEHHAVMETCRALERYEGAEVTYLPVDSEGLVDPDSVKKSIRPDTCLISVMTANNEIGTIEPVKEIGEIARGAGIPFHTDAVQAYGHIPMDVGDMNIDLMSASAHKMGGPKGTGFLYIRNGLRLRPLIEGGSQERNMRAGTLNVPGIAGLGAAARQVPRSIEQNGEYTRRLRDHFIERALKEIPGATLNGHKSLRLPGNVNITLEGTEGETVLILLDREGICASSGSACSTGAVEPSHVLLAIGLDESSANGTLRFTLSHHNTIEEIDRVVDTLIRIRQRL